MNKNEEGLKMVQAITKWPTSREDYPFSLDYFIKSTEKEVLEAAKAGSGLVEKVAVDHKRLLDTKKWLESEEAANLINKHLEEAKSKIEWAIKTGEYPYYMEIESDRTALSFEEEGDYEGKISSGRPVLGDFNGYAATKKSLLYFMAQEIAQSLRRAGFQVSEDAPVHIVDEDKYLEFYRLLITVRWR